MAALNDEADRPRSDADAWIAEVARFASLSASLDDAFSDRSAVLVAEGFDETSWALAKAAFCARLAQPGTPGRPPPIDVFRTTYASVRRRLVSSRLPAKVATTRSPSAAEPAVLMSPGATTWPVPDLPTYLRPDQTNAAQLDRPVPIATAPPVAAELRLPTAGAIALVGAPFDPERTWDVASTSRPSLPFAPSTEGECTPAAAPLSDLEDQAGMTQAAPSVQGSATLPFDAGGALDLMRLDRYVAFAVALRDAEGDAERIMSQFGLETAQQRAKIHGLWRVRFEANPDLRERFEALVAARSAAR